MNVSRLSLLDSHLRSYVDREMLAGVSALIEHRGTEVFRHQSGYADVASSKKLDNDTVFRIYSLSKPITSAALMRLFEQGRLLLTDPVSDYLPELGELMVYAGEGELASCHREIEIADLLLHSAGFAYGHEDHPVDELYRSSKPFRYEETIADMVARLGRLPLKYQPGESWEYSVAHDVLGRVIEVVSGQRFDRFLAREVFEPMGMHRTAFTVATEKRRDLATLYTLDADRKLTEYDAPDARLCTQDSLFFAGGEGLVSTIDDCRIFARMLLNRGDSRGEQFLSRKSVDLMTMNHLDKKQRKKMWLRGHGFGFGLGVLIDPAAYRNLGTKGEFGWAGSGSTYFWVDPEEQLLSVLFAQFVPSSEYTLAREFKTLMYQAMS